MSLTMAKEDSRRANDSQDKPTDNDDQYRPSEQTRPARHPATVRRYKENISVSALRLHLLLISFGTGLLDAATYSDLGIFASNQTGNTIILLVEAINRANRSSNTSPSNADVLSVGISLASFLCFGLLFGQIGVSRFVGPRTRGWLIFSTFVQAAFLFIASLLVQVGVLKVGADQRDNQTSATLTVFLLAASAGVQVAMAKSVNVKEIPTAMLTSPYVDTLIDKSLFAFRIRGKDVASRNVRLGYFAFFASGTVVGAAARAYSGTATVLWISFALRSANLFYILVAPGHTERHGKKDEKEKGEHRLEEKATTDPGDSGRAKGRRNDQGP